MSQHSTTTASSSGSNFRAIFVAALKAYEKKTKTDLHTHPLAIQLQSCQSSSDILAVLHDKVNESDQSTSHNKRLSSWLDPTINILYAFSSTVVQGVGLVSLNWSPMSTVCLYLFLQIFSPAQVISAGVGVLFLVKIILVTFVQGFLTVMYVRQPRMSRQVKKHSLISSSASSTSSNGSKLTQKCHQLTQ